MNVQVVFQQMLVIVALVCLGIWMYKKQYISDEMTGKLSSIVVDVCNPMLCISCGLSAGEATSRRNIAVGMLTGAIIYLLTVILGFLVPKLCRIKRDQQKFYNMMLVYANTGFIGIPVAKAVLPAEAMVYVVIVNILFSVLVYTHGVMVMRAGKKETGQKEGPRFKITFGLLCSIFTIVIFWFHFSLPQMATDCTAYIGNATTFLSMSLLGCSFAAISLKALFANRDLYLFSVIKMLLIPLGIGYLMKIFGVDERMLEAFVLMLAMPAANLPLMMAKKNGEDTQILTRGILLTTMLTPVTLTLVTFLISRM